MRVWDGKPYKCKVLTHITYTIQNLRIGVCMCVHMCVHAHAHVWLFLNLPFLNPNTKMRRPIRHIGKSEQRAFEMESLVASL